VTHRETTDGAANQNKTLYLKDNIIEGTKTAGSYFLDCI